jgi:hypothetical protein
VVEFPESFEGFCASKLSEIAWQQQLRIFKEQLIAFSKIAHILFAPNKLFKFVLIESTSISFGLEIWVDDFSFNTTAQIFSVPL